MTTNRTFCAATLPPRQQEEQKFVAATSFCTRCSPLPLRAPNSPQY
jgi:hypothetical protein